MTVFAKQNPTVGSQLSATRSSFMITDILAAKVGDDIVSERMPAGNLNDFDSDEDFGDDGNSSVCSNDKEINVTHHSGRTLTSSSKKQRKARTAFSDHQLHSLEKSFTRQKYLSVQDRMELANKLGISDTQVKTWFQNRRTKWKRQTSVGFELLVEAGNYAAYQRAYQRNYPQLDGWQYPSSLQVPPSPAELYYRQASLAALHSQSPFGLYPGASLNLTKPPAFPLLNPSTSTSSSSPSSIPIPPQLNSYYQNLHRMPPQTIRSNSPLNLGRGSPTKTNEINDNTTSDDEETIEV
ncbi:hypothetical protein HA402_003720 [Bradysia odoriphaga]|nr:hypothetical protein HA402_003720 [Bradysia odoriphaga]